MTSLDIANLIQANAARWPEMVIDFDAVTEIQGAAARLIGAKARYQALFDATHVPWPVIAVIHEREASQNWNLNIAQGDPWSAVSVHVPAGEGPFGSWEEAAIHALTADDHLDQWKHFDTIGGTLAKLELYNGGGYCQRVLPSPYIWARTNQYVSGKFVGDHNFDANFVDTQDGCAPLIACMMAQDPTIARDFGWEAPPAQPVLTGADGVLHDTRWLQTVLNQLGTVPPLKVDGMWGRSTAAALRKIQANAGLPASGRFDVATLQSLETQIGTPLPGTQQPLTQA